MARFQLIATVLLAVIVALVNGICQTEIAIHGACGYVEIPVCSVMRLSLTNLTNPCRVVINVSFVLTMKLNGVFDGDQVFVAIESGSVIGSLKLGPSFQVIGASISVTSSLVYLFEMTNTSLQSGAKLIFDNIRTTGGNFALSINNFSSLVNNSLLLVQRTTLEAAQFEDCDIFGSIITFSNCRFESSGSPALNWRGGEITQSEVTLTNCTVVHLGVGFPVVLVEVPVTESRLVSSYNAVVIFSKGPSLWLQTTSMLHSFLITSFNDWFNISATGNATGNSYWMLASSAEQMSFVNTTLAIERTTVMLAGLRSVILIRLEYPQVERTNVSITRSTVTLKKTSNATGVVLGIDLRKANATLLAATLTLNKWLLDSQKDGKAYIGFLSQVENSTVQFHDEKIECIGEECWVWQLSEDVSGFAFVLDSSRVTCSAVGTSGIIEAQAIAVSNFSIILMDTRADYSSQSNIYFLCFGYRGSRLLVVTTLSVNSHSNTFIGNSQSMTGFLYMFSGLTKAPNTISLSESTLNLFGKIRAFLLLFEERVQATELEVIVSTCAIALQGKFTEILKLFNLRASHLIVQQNVVSMIAFFFASTFTLKNVQNSHVSSSFNTMTIQSSDGAQWVSCTGTIQYSAVTVYEDVVQIEGLLTQFFTSTLPAALTNVSISVVSLVLSMISFSQAILLLFSTSQGSRNLIVCIERISFTAEIPSHEKKELSPIAIVVGFLEGLFEGASMLSRNNSVNFNVTPSAAGYVFLLGQNITSVFFTQFSSIGDTILMHCERAIYLHVHGVNLVSSPFFLFQGVNASFFSSISNFVAAFQLSRLPRITLEDSTLQFIGNLGAIVFNLNNDVGVFEVWRTKVLLQLPLQARSLSCGFFCVNIANVSNFFLAISASDIQITAQQAELFSGLGNAQSNVEVSVRQTSVLLTGNYEVALLRALPSISSPETVFSGMHFFLSNNTIDLRCDKGVLFGLAILTSSRLSSVVLEGNCVECWGLPKFLWISFPSSTNFTVIDKNTTLRAFATEATYISFEGECAFLHADIDQILLTLNATDSATFVKYGERVTDSEFAFTGGAVSMAAEGEIVAFDFDLCTTCLLQLKEIDFVGVSFGNMISFVAAAETSKVVNASITIEACSIVFEGESGFFLTFENVSGLLLFVCQSQVHVVAQDFACGCSAAYLEVASIQFDHNRFELIGSVSRWVQTVVATHLFLSSRGDFCLLSSNFSSQLIFANRLGIQNRINIEHSVLTVAGETEATAILFGNAETVEIFVLEATFTMFGAVSYFYWTVASESLSMIIIDSILLVRSTEVSVGVYFDALTASEVHVESYNNSVLIETSGEWASWVDTFQYGQLEPSFLLLFNDTYQNITVCSAQGDAALFWAIGTLLIRSFHSFVTIESAKDSVVIECPFQNTNVLIYNMTAFFNVSHGNATIVKYLEEGNVSSWVNVSSSFFTIHATAAAGVTALSHSLLSDSVLWLSDLQVVVNLPAFPLLQIRHPLRWSEVHVTFRRCYVRTIEISANVALIAVPRDFSLFLFENFVVVVECNYVNGVLSLVCGPFLPVVAGCMGSSSASASIHPTTSISETQTRTSSIPLTVSLRSLTLTSSSTYSMYQSSSYSMPVPPTVTLSTTFTVESTITEQQTQSMTRSRTPVRTFSVSLFPTFTITAVASHTGTETTTVLSTMSLDETATYSNPETETTTITETETDTLQASSSPSSSLSCATPRILGLAPAAAGVFETYRVRKLVVEWNVSAILFNESSDFLKVFSASSWGSVASVNVTNKFTLRFLIALPETVILTNNYLVIVSLSTESFKCRTDSVTKLQSITKINGISLPTPENTREVTATTAVLTSVAAPPGVATAQARGAMMLELSVCKYSHSAPLPRSLSPLQMHFGPEIGSYYRGAVLGNLLLFSGVVIIFFAVVAVRRKRGKIDWTAAAAKAQMPGLLIIPFSMLLQPTISSSVSLSLHGVGNFDIVISFLCWLVIGCGLVWILMIVLVLFRAVPKRKDDTYLPPSGWNPFYFIVRISYRETEWCDADEGELWAPRHRRVFQSLREGMHWFVVFEIVMSLFFGIVEGIRPDTSSSCQKLIVATFVLSLSFLPFALFMRPHCSAFGRVFFVVTSCLLAVCSFLLLLPWEEGKTFGDFLAMASVGLGVVAMMRTIINKTYKYLLKKKLREDRIAATVIAPPIEAPLLATPTLGNTETTRIQEATSTSRRINESEGAQRASPLGRRIKNRRFERWQAEQEAIREYEMRTLVELQELLQDLALQRPRTNPPGQMTSGNTLQ